MAPDAGEQVALSAEEWKRHLRELPKRFARRGVSQEVARDLAQETLLRVWKGLGGFRGEAELETWVISISKKVWLQYRRYRGQQKRSADEVSLDAEGFTPSNERFLATPPAASPEQLTADRTRIDWALEQLAGMSTAMQDALLLRMEENSYEEIAQILRVPVSQVSSLLHQVRQKLRRGDPFRSDNPPS